MTRTEDEDRPSPQLLLWRNAEQFFETFARANAAHMACGPGCSRCCFTDITVSASEAVEILRWADGLDAGARAQLERALDGADRAPGPDAAGTVRDPCAMLSGGACAIYPVRPLICRTQGLVLLFRSPGGGEDRVADVCPLNFTSAGSMPAQETWLDLDRTNALMAIAAHNPRRCAQLDLLHDRLDGDGRISLARVRQLIAATAAPSR